MMKKRLKRNIYRLDDHVVLSKVEDLPALKTTYTGSTLKYPYQFWINKLAKIPDDSDGGKDVQEVIEDFFITGFLFWVEVLILTGNLDIGVQALHNIEQWYVLVSHT